MLISYVKLDHVIYYEIKYGISKSTLIFIPLT